MASLSAHPYAFLVASLLVFFLSFGHEAATRGAAAMRNQGGIHDCEGFQNSAEIQGLARFAVEEYNKKQVREGCRLPFFKALIFVWKQSSLLDY